MSHFTDNHSQWLDSAVPVPEPSRVPIESQASVGLLLEAILDELRKMNSTPREGAASSCEIKFLAPTKDHPRATPSPVIKKYAGSPVPVTEAIEDYSRAIREATAAQMAGWAATVDNLARSA